MPNAGIGWVDFAGDGADRRHGASGEDALRYWYWRGNVLYVNYFTPVPKNDQRERATTLSATALQRCFDRLSARLDHRRGPAPFISTWLFATCHSTFPIGIYVVICAIISIIATSLLPDYTNKDISSEEHYEEPL